MAAKELSQAPNSTDLSFMHSISPNIAYFDSSMTLSTSNQTEPGLIIVFGWMNARDAHLAKYVSQYLKTYPKARILLIRCSVEQFFVTPLRVRALRPALPVLQNFMAESEASIDTNTPRMLLHVFSNGGVSTSVMLWNMLKAEAAAERIPLHVTVMDSCPGYGRWDTSYHAMSLLFPFWLSPLAHLVVGVFWLIFVPTGVGLPQDNNANAFNETIRMQRELRRTYTYGTGDKAVAWQDVEAHAKEAGARGLNVRMEAFEGAAHVSHARVDPERYWRIVNETWGDRDLREQADE